MESHEDFPSDDSMSIDALTTAVDEHSDQPNEDLEMSDAFVRADTSLWHRNSPAGRDPHISGGSKNGMKLRDTPPNARVPEVRLPPESTVRRSARIVGKQQSQASTPSKESSSRRDASRRRHSSTIPRDADGEGLKKTSTKAPATKRYYVETEEPAEPQEIPDETIYAKLVRNGNFLSYRWDIPLHGIIGQAITDGYTWKFHLPPDESAPTSPSEPTPERVPARGILKKPGNEAPGAAKGSAKVSWDMSSVTVPEISKPGSSKETEEVSSKVLRQASRKASGKTRAPRKVTSEKATTKASVKAAMKAPAKGLTKASTREKGAGETWDQ